MRDSERRAVLEAVLHLRRAPQQLATMVSRLPWDAEEPLVIATRRDVLRVLQDALSGRVPLGHVQPWASLLDGREDVGRETGHEALLNECFFELSSPSLTGLEMEALVRQWTRKLA